MGYEGDDSDTGEGNDDSAFQPPAEIREPDWSSDDSGSDDDSGFRLPPDIREPDWTS